jgi:DHA1 family tetracycline resistance protein-like MFS transporter
MGVGTAAFAFLAGRLADAFGAVAGLLATGALLAFGAIALVLVPGSEAAVAIAIVLVGANLAPLAVLSAVVEPHLTARRRAAGFAALGCVFGVGASGGSALAGILYEVDARLPYLATAVVALPMATLLAVAVRRVARSAPPAEVT